tara:strand:- start:570 stop:1730 length:1161 start_codon:yes stop_codon:yes gene_type:complete
MELFFMISGFFSCMVLQFKDNRYFLRQRIKKLLVPFVVWLPIVILLNEAAWTYHEWKYYGFHSDQSFVVAVYRVLVSEEFRERFRPKPDGQNFGTEHLWFLYYLMMFVAANALAVAIRWPVAIQTFWARTVSIADWVLAKPWRIVLPCVALVPIVAIPKWHTVYEGPFSIVPVFRYFAYFGFAYLVGYLLYLNRHHLETLKRNWAWYFLLSVVGWAFLMVRDWIQPQFLVNVYDEGARRGFAMNKATPSCEFATFDQQFLFPPVRLFANEAAPIDTAESLLLLPPFGVLLVMLATSLALFGVFLRYLDRPSGLVRYWSDSAYFLYVIHLPLSSFIPSLMLPLPWNGLVKFVLGTLATTGVGLILYEYCVRYTFIGRQMNGPRSRTS